MPTNHRAPSPSSHETRLRQVDVGSRKRRPEQDLADLESAQPKRRNRAQDTPNDHPGELQDPPCHDAKSKAQEKEEEEVRQELELFQEYSPCKLDFGAPHADPVVESLSLSAAQPPDIVYGLHIGDAGGSLSNLQLEAICYSCQRHEQHLADGQRAGFFLGDGPGVGKGRSIAGLILENWRCGRKRHLWVSISADLQHDARRDLDDVGASSIALHPLVKKPYEPLDRRCGVEEGVVFLTYSTLISGAGKGSIKTRMDQVLQWCGEDFDGLIIFDESHKAKNLVANSSSSTKTGDAVLQIQEKLPQARVLYCSATGASEVRNMAYMVRLGLWGEAVGGFRSFEEFREKVGRWGVGALELVAMEMKSRGMYLCRTLSFHGIEFEVQSVELGPEMRSTYRRACTLWQNLMVDFHLALRELTAEERRDHGRVWPQFWGAHQRFFRQLCMAAKVQATVSSAQEAIAQGQCVVIGLQSTGETRLAELAKETGSEMDDVASGLRETVLQLLEKHWPMPFPTAQTKALFPENLLDQGKPSPAGHPSRPKRGGQSRKSKGGKEKDSAPVETIDLCSSDSDGETARKSPMSDQKASVAPPGPSTIHRQAGRSKTRWRRASPVPKMKSPGFTIQKRLTIQAPGMRKKTDGRRGSAGQKHQPNNGKGRMEWEEEEEEEVEVISLMDSDDCGEDEGPSMKPTTVPRQKGRKCGNEGGLLEACETTSIAAPNFEGKGEGDDEDCCMDDLEGSPGKAKSSRLQSNPVGQNQSEVQMSTDPYDIATCLKKKAMDYVKKMELPANPLDVLVDRLGGPDKVAEMTGRRGRFVRTEEGVKFEPRNTSGVKEGVSLEAINVAEAKHFMEGEKLVAIISDAASAGISLHADRRHANQRRRVHLTLELPWSADKAVQQFGRSHRSNQATAPKYRMMMTSLGGESRFAAAVAKRLQNLGALTQGDRNAGPELGNFHYDNVYGRQALKMLYNIVMGKEEPKVLPSSGAHENFDDFEDFKMNMRREMVSVGLITSKQDPVHLYHVIKGELPACEKVGCVQSSHQMDIPRFLNRLLGMEPEAQNVFFDYYLDLLKHTIQAAKQDGSFDTGIKDLSAEKVEVKGSPSVISTQAWGGKTLLYKVSIDRGLDFESAHRKLANRIQASDDHQEDGFYRSKRTGAGGIHHSLLALKSSVDNKYQVFRPSTGLAARKISLTELRRKYVAFPSEEECRNAWTAAYEGGGNRLQEMDVLAGEILPVWDVTWQAILQLSPSEQRKVKIVRLQTTDSSQKRIIGMHVPRDAIPWVKGGARLQNRVPGKVPEEFK